MMGSAEKTISELAGQNVCSFRVLMESIESQIVPHIGDEKQKKTESESESQDIDPGCEFLLFEDPEGQLEMIRENGHLFSFA